MVVLKWRLENERLYPYILVLIAVKVTEVVLCKAERFKEISYTS